MRTNGEIERDAHIVATLRRCADALDAIAGTLAAFLDMVKAAMRDDEQEAEP